MRKSALHFLAAAIAAPLFACVAPVDETAPRASVEDTDRTEQAAYISNAHRWSHPWGISVCWANGYDSAGHDQFPVVRQMAQNAVQREYGTRSEFWLNFSGWQRCVSGVHANVRVWIQPGGVYSSGLGNEVDGQDIGVSFNGCVDHDPVSQVPCLEYQIVHEFGHVAGLSHEQNRPDTPSGTGALPQGENGDEVVGAWDWNAVMNYANPIQYPTKLSASEVLGLHELYIDAPSSRVTMWQARYRAGNKSSFGWGRYTANRGQLSVGNDAVSSLTVPAGLSVRLCTDEGSNGAGTGTCRTFAANTDYVGDIDDNTSFAEISPAITAYRDPNRSGVAQGFGPGEYFANRGDLSVVGNDLISSFRVPAGVVVVACKHETKIDCATYMSDTSYIGDSMNDNISYLHVIPVAVGYLSAYFGGPSATFYPGGVYGAASLGAMGNDQMSSLRVPPGLRVTYCTENSPPAADVANGTGQCRRINGDFGGTPFVGDAMNDQASYVKVDYE